MFTFLAVAFIVLIVVAVFYGFGIVMRRPPTTEELETETCTLCRKRFDKSALVERQVGDARLFFFCHDCIQKLHEDVEQVLRSRH